VECALDRSLAQPAGSREPSPEARLVLGFFDDGQTDGGIVFGYQEEYGIGADVDGGKSLP
jgi:hypothetical protein